MSSDRPRPQPLYVRGELHEHRTVDSDGEVCWSRVSAADGSHITGGARIRLCVETRDEQFVISDVAVTSHAPTFQPVRDRQHHTVGLTREEAEWVHRRLGELLVAPAKT